MTKEYLSMWSQALSGNISIDTLRCWRKTGSCRIKLFLKCCMVKCARLYITWALTHKHSGTTFSQKCFFCFVQHTVWSKAFDFFKQEAIFFCLGGCLHLCWDSAALMFLHFCDLILVLQVECVGSVDSGLSVMSWSPDQELVLLATGINNSL